MAKNCCNRNPVFVQNVLKSHQNDVPYDPDAVAYFNKVVANGGAELSTSWKQYLNETFFIPLKETNIPEYIRYHCLSNEHEIAALTCLNDPDLPMAQTVGSPEFFPYIGYVLNGVDQYIITNFTPSTDGGVKYTVNGGSFGFKIISNTAGLTAVNIGATDNTNKDYIFSSLNGNNVYTAISQDNNGGDVNEPNTELDQNYSGVRTDNSNITIFQENTGTSYASASNGLVSRVEYLGAYNNGTPAFFAPGTYQSFFYGSKDVDIEEHNEVTNELTSFKKELLVYGDSIANGDLANFKIYGWIASFARQRGHKINLNAVQGTCLEKVSPIDPGGTSPNLIDALATMPVYNPARHAGIIIAYITNDVGYNFPNYTLANFGTQARQARDYIIDTLGFPPERVIWAGKYYTTEANWADYSIYSGAGPGWVQADNARKDEFDDELQDVASERGCVYFQPQAHMAGGTGPDGRHPDTAHHILITTGALTDIPILT